MVLSLTRTLGALCLACERECQDGRPGHNRWPGALVTASLSPFARRSCPVAKACTCWCCDDEVAVPVASAAGSVAAAGACRRRTRARAAGHGHVRTYEYDPQRPLIGGPSLDHACLDGRCLLASVCSYWQLARYGVGQGRPAGKP